MKIRLNGGRREDGQPGRGSLSASTVKQAIKTNSKLSNVTGL